MLWWLRAARSRIQFSKSEEKWEGQMRILLSFLSVALVAAQTGEDCALECQNEGQCRSGKKAYGFEIHPSHDHQEAIDQILGGESSALGEYCECDPYFTGLACNVKYGHCNGGKHPCFHGGECDPTLTTDTYEETYICDCRKAVDENGTRYVGKYCEYPALTRCSDDPNDFCVNGGTCQNNGICDCPFGFKGNHCEFHADTVQPDCKLVCLNGGHCAYGYRDATQAEQAFGKSFQPNIDFQHCVCPSGYAGTHCQVQTDICNNPDDSDKEDYCLHGGECKSFTNPITQVTNFYCDCNSADHDGKKWTGGQCEHAATSYCTQAPGINGHPFCANDGVCIEHENGAHDCNCTEGYTGTRCEFSPEQEAPESHDACTLDCSPNGRCREGPRHHGVLTNFADIEHVINSTITGNEIEHCECFSGYAGVTCAIKTEVCGEGEHVCFHGSSCVEDDGDWRCKCEDSDKKVAGRHCQHEATATCGGHGFCTNKGRCEVEEGEFTGFCICPKGYTGKHCERSELREVIDRTAPGQGASHQVASDQDPYKIAFIVLVATLAAVGLLVGIVYLTSRGARKEKEATAQASAGTSVEEATETAVPAQDKEMA